MLCERKSEPFPKRQILDSSKMKEFADDDFKFDKNERKLKKGGHDGPVSLTWVIFPTKWSLPSLFLLF